jgi:hypothetical protein
MKVWRYVLAADTGTAPNYEAPCLTLALCKPQLRQNARPGDLVVAFAGRDLHENPDAIIWAGLLTESIGFADYWRDPRFQSKKGAPPRVVDNIYEPHPGEPDGFKQHPHVFHDRDSKARDIGGRNVLIFGGPDVWVFRNSPPVLPKRFGLSMGNARRGHQICHIDETAWHEIRDWLSTPTTNGRCFVAGNIAISASHQGAPSRSTRRC